jgi:hypothetical protein
VLSAVADRVWVLKGARTRYSEHEELETRLLRALNCSKKDVRFIVFKKGYDRRTQLILSEKITSVDTCREFHMHISHLRGCEIITSPHKQGEL